MSDREVGCHADRQDPERAPNVRSVGECLFDRGAALAETPLFEQALRLGCIDAPGWLMD
jgi:hypothetical protein